MNSMSKETFPVINNVLIILICTFIDLDHVLNVNFKCFSKIAPVTHVISFLFVLTLALADN